MYNRAMEEEVAALKEARQLKKMSHLRLWISVREHCVEKQLLLSEAGLEKSMLQSAHRF